MKLFRNLAALFLCAVLMCQPAAFCAERNGIKNGAYISLGSYMGRDIIWRCVGSDANGALLISRDILCFKAFSSAYGKWDDSFLRIWLNSDEQQVSWGELSPTEQSVNGNAYAEEPGFLSGFSEEEKKLIKTVTQKSVVNVTLSDASNTGSQSHVYNSSGVFSGSVQNYSDAIGVITEDKVFCPNLLQMEILAANYPSEFISRPTAQAVAQSGSSRNSEDRSNSYYWLRDGIGNEEFPDAVRCVFPDGKVFFSDADDGSVGVRPAIYVDKNLSPVSGKGYEAEPYRLTETEGTSTPTAKGTADRYGAHNSLQGSFASITEGDYLVMGEEQGREILWKCVEINENGPLMVSDKILSFKAFDAMGPHSDELRNQYGSNSWKMSNLRYWLNSWEGEGEKNWPCSVAPSSDRTYSGNGYAMEKGFLAGFSPEERELIKAVNNITVIHPIDIDETTSGTEPLEMKRNINSPTNFANAFTGVTEEKIFLLSIEETKRIKNRFRDFITATPTPEAVSENEASIDDLSADRSASWWLRDAEAEENGQASVRVISRDGWVTEEYAANPAVGVRPAFYLDMEKTGFISGAGTEAEPYRVQSHSFGQWVVTKEATCDEQGVKSAVCSVCGEIREESIPAPGHDFAEEKVTSKGIYKIISRRCSRCGIVSYEKRFSLVPAVCGALAAAVLLIIFLRSRK